MRKACGLHRREQTILDKYWRITLSAVVLRQTRIYYNVCAVSKGGGNCFIRNTGNQNLPYYDRYHSMHYVRYMHNIVYSRLIIGWKCFVAFVGTCIEYVLKRPNLKTLRNRSLLRSNSMVIQSRVPFKGVQSVHSNPREIVVLDSHSYQFSSFTSINQYFCLRILLNIHFFYFCYWNFVQLHFTRNSTIWIDFK